MRTFADEECGRLHRTVSKAAAQLMRAIARTKRRGCEMERWVWALAAILLLSSVVGCGRGNEATTELPPHRSQPTGPVEPTSGPNLGTTGDASVCPPNRGEGTISPAVSIDSISFLVNGLEQVVRGDEALNAQPGDAVQVREATICVGPFSGNGGDACVDWVPIDQRGEEIVSEHRGTHMVPLTPGSIRISGPGGTWVIGENWISIAAVVNHWPPENTEDLNCGGGRCERDDRIVVVLRGSGGN